MNYNYNWVYFTICFYNNKCKKTCLSGEQLPNGKQCTKLITLVKDECEKYLEDDTKNTSIIATELSDTFQITFKLKLN